MTGGEPAGEPEEGSHMTEKLIIANCSGFYGDRISAAREMVQGGPIDVLTGDYLAELTMAILFRNKMKNPKAGYAGTFLKQMEEVMGECLQKKIRVVTNAGGLNPRGMAEELEKIAEKLGLKPKIAFIEGDDLTRRLAELQKEGEAFAHMDKGTPLKDARANTVTANAYLGGWGISEALGRGADIVVTGRVTDAAVVVGPAAWRFNWKRDDWDRLAGAVAAGHIIECGGQATGGNYSFVDEVPTYRNLGFPLCEMHADGSFVISKHPGTGGLVSVGTVTAQLLYEIQGHRYYNPDVIARFDTLKVSQEGPDRVRVEGAKGEPPTPTTKVCINNLGPFRNQMTVLLTGLDIEKKAKIVEEMFFDAVGGREQFQRVEVNLIRTDHENPASNEQAFAYLKINVIDPNPKKVGKAFSSRVVELALCSIPGFTMTSPPGDEIPSVIYWPALVSSDKIRQKVYVGGEELNVEAVQAPQTPPAVKVPEVRIPPVPKGDTVKKPLGRAFATRSGDKGGNANVGIWSKTPEGYAFLREFLTTERLKEILPDARPFEVERYEFPNLNALNFYIRGILGDGVASSTRSDPQAKTLGEYLRARVVEMPGSIVVK